MTKKLFWEDPYLDHCVARVTAIDGCKVKVDQTVFYAFSGGQESDAGTIGGVEVVEAVKQGDKEDIIDIEYTLAEVPSFSVGDEVEIKIDAERRTGLRNYHSLAHLMYYFVIAELGKVKIKGSHVSAEKCRMDFDFDSSVSETLPAIAEKMNAFLAQGHEIKCVPDSEKADLRWWTCDAGEFGVWKMPCGGTHVRNTSELADFGSVQLKRVTKGKGRERIILKVV